MKLVLTNSNLVFKTATVITKTVSKTFTAGEVGGEAHILLNLDTPIAPNVPFKITITGDAVVSNYGWDVAVNTPQNASGTQIAAGIPLFADDYQISANIKIENIDLNRGSLASAGTVNVTVKYAEVQYNDLKLTDTLTLNNGVGEVLFTLPNAISAPCYFNITGNNKTGGIENTTNLKVHFLDASSNEISSVTTLVPQNLKAIKCSGSTQVKYVKVDRAGMSALSGTVEITLYYYPDL